MKRWIFLLYNVSQFLLFRCLSERYWNQLFILPGSYVMSIVELISPVPGLNARLSQNICFMQTPVASSQILFIIIVTTVELTDAFRSATTMLTRVIVNNFLENLLAICRCFESFPVVSSYVVFLNEVNILSHHCTFQMLSLPSASLTFSALTCRTSFFLREMFY